jgi:hypothetical protein
VREENLVSGTLEGFWVEKRVGVVEGGRENTRGPSEGKYMKGIHQPPSYGYAGVTNTGSQACPRC